MALSYQESIPPTQGTKDNVLQNVASAADCCHLLVPLFVWDLDSVSKRVDKCMGVVKDVLCYSNTFAPSIDLFTIDSWNLQLADESKFSNALLITKKQPKD